MPSELLTIPTDVPLLRIIYDFVSESEERYVIGKVDSVGGDSSKAGNWTDLNGRRSMYWGGTVISSQTLIPAPFPSFMDSSWPKILGRITDTKIFEEEISGFDRKGKSKGPNHCLVNEYIGKLNQGIMPHTDGPAYDPIVATLSLGSHTILSLKPITVDSTVTTIVPTTTETSLDVEESTISSSSAASTSSLADQSFSKAITIFLPPRSLLLLSSSLYSTYHHSIENKSVDLMEELTSCSNWEQWWLDGARGLDSTLAPSETAEVEVEGAMARIEEEEGEGEDDEGSLGELRRKVAGSFLSTTIKSNTSVAEEGKEETVETEEDIVKNLVARKRMVESGSGWERGRRISLTCRRVGKVRKGLRLG